MPRSESSHNLPLTACPNGLTWTQTFCPLGMDPWATVEWSTRDCTINDSNGGIVFQQLSVLAPVDWSDTAVNIAASKYFRGHIGEDGREGSIRQMIDRVAKTICEWGFVDGYFASYDDSEAFYNDMVWLLLHQAFAFNSPVWFNIGAGKTNQASACFLNSVDDTMESIMELAATETRLFKGGSGAGVNLSKIRGSMEKLSGGGMASGPVSFLRGYDAFAGVVQSGGATRRAAKMVQLNADHPNIEEFISCKVVEEKKAHALIAMGYSGAFSAKDGAYSTVAFQNANHSIRVTDDFMRAVANGDSWALTERTTGMACKLLPAADLFHSMAEAAWFCGDPGLMFDTTINDWHTCPKSGRINTVNPCGEYNFLDDTACNLASLNLMKFRRKSHGGLDYKGFVAACALSIVAQDILVDRADYPTEKFKQNSHDFRPLGLGYANLGSLLMSCGLGYGTPEGREMAAEITALMQVSAYTTSAVLAKVKGAFNGYAVNKDAMLGVIVKHWDASLDAHQSELLHGMWDYCHLMGTQHGYRNSQVTVLAPTGTIGMLMDCSTTGIEPNIALVSYKKLVGGGYMKLVNNGVREALIEGCGYTESEAAEITAFVEEHGTIEGAPYITEGPDSARHLAVFDCALKPQNGMRYLSPDAHIRMMASVQPFLSGAISKTCNVPNSYTVEDIKDLYMCAWKLGLKSITVYRDGCKMSQPLNTKKEEVKSDAGRTNNTVAAAELPGSNQVAQAPFRRRLPIERQSLTHKFDVGGHEGYITVGLHEDGTPGEIFLVMAKEGSTISGLMDAFATSISLGLQYGVPLETLVAKFSHTRFEPSGFTGSPELGFASSLIDYIFRWLDLRFGATKPVVSLGSISAVSTPTRVTPISDAPFCTSCGSMMIRSGSCYRCTNCGGTSGCS